MNIGDAILVLVDKLLVEREKTVRLELLENKKKQEEQKHEDYT